MARKPSGKMFLFFSFLMLVQQGTTSCYSVSPNTASCSARVSTTPLLLSVRFDKIQETPQKCNVKSKKANKQTNPVTWQSRKLLSRKGGEGRREGGGVPTLRPGRGTRPSIRYCDIVTMQSDPFTSDQTWGPKRPSIKTGLKHPTKVRADTAPRKSTAFPGTACASEVCLAPLRPSAGRAWSRGMGLPNCLSCRAHWGNKWQKQCPSGFFSFSPYYRVTVHVTLWYWVIYHHWVPRLAPLEKNQRKQQGLGFDEEETNSSLQEHANFSATLCTPTHAIPGCSFPPPAAPFSIPALLPFLCSDSVLRFYGFLCQLPQGYSLEWTHLQDY